MLELLESRVGGVLPLAGIALVMLPSLAVVGAFLRRAGWNGPAAPPARCSLVTDLAYVVLGPLTEVASRVATTFGIAACAVGLGMQVGPDLLEGFGPVAGQPRWLIVTEILVLSDFVYYWVHRAAHSVPWMWRLHAIHHSTEHLRWSSALRAHPAEIYLHVVTVLPLFVLGFPVDALVALAPLVTLYAVWIHTNVHVTLRPVSYVVNTPVFHGWHHARDVSDGTKNFAGFFPLFDALFGTYHVPARLPPEFGIDDPDVPETLWAQLVYPFRSREPAHPASASRPEYREPAPPLGSSPVAALASSD